MNLKSKTFYHGTKSIFNSFRDYTIGKNYGQRFGKGFYFSELKSHAEYYAKNSKGNGPERVMQVYLNISNPLIVKSVLEYRQVINNEKEKRSSNRFEAEKLLLKDDNQILQELGYDGIIYLFNNYMVEVVAFNNSQIKILNSIKEEIKLDINKGDTILTGKFRNKKVVVKDIGTDEYGLPTINGKGIMKIRIQKLMPKEKKKIKEALISLIEKYSGKKVILERPVAPSPEALTKVQQVIAFSKNQDFVQQIAAVIQHWFRGTFMGQTLDAANHTKIEKSFRALQKIYGKPIFPKIYRALHLKVPPNATEEQILKLTTIRTGPSKIQSWSSRRQGAEYYFNHFASEQNHSDTPKHGWAWVLVEGTPSSNLEILTTAENMNQYLADCAKALEFLKIQGLEDADTLLLKMADHFNEPDMTKQYEVICKTTEKVSVKILKVFVQTLPESEPEPESEEEDSLSHLLRVLGVR